MRKLSGNRQEPLSITLDLFDQIMGKSHFHSGPNITQWQTPHTAYGSRTEIFQTCRDLAQRQFSCVTEFRKVKKQALVNKNTAQAVLKAQGIFTLSKILSWQYFTEGEYSDANSKFIPRPLVWHIVQFFFPKT